MRYENVDLIRELTAQKEAALAARAAAETASLAKSQFLAAASHDLRQPLHAMGLFAAALASKVRDPGVTPLVASIRASVEALEHLFAQLLDLSQLDAGALRPAPAAVALQPLFARLRDDFAPQAMAAGLVLRVVPTRMAVATDPMLLERVLRNLHRQRRAVHARRRHRRGRATPRGGSAHRRDRFGRRHREGRFDAHLRRVRATRRGAAQPRRRPRPGTGSCDRAQAREPLRTPDRARLDAGPRVALLDHRAACERHGRAEPLPRVRGPSAAAFSSDACRSPHRRRRRRSCRGRSDGRPLRVVACRGHRRRRTRGRFWPLWTPALGDPDLIVADLRLAGGESGIDAIARAPCARSEPTRRRSWCRATRAAQRRRKWLPRE